jgi:hypothetical protein
MTNSAAILVPQMARVWLAPLGTTAPGDPLSPMPTGWVDVGLFDPASLQWQASPSYQTVQSHQSIYPTRRFKDADAATVSCSLQEWNGTNILAVYGGGTIATMHGTSPQPTTWYEYIPDISGVTIQTEACIEIIDGAKHYRRVIPVSEPDSGATVTYHRTAESTLPLSLAVIYGGTGLPWYEWSDDAAWAN